MQSNFAFDDLGLTFTFSHRQQSTTRRLAHLAEVHLEDGAGLDESWAGPVGRVSERSVSALRTDASARSGADRCTDAHGHCTSHVGRSVCARVRGPRAKAHL